MTKQTAAKAAAVSEQADGAPALALTKAQKAQVAKLETVSSRIRYLDSQGFSRSDITKLIPNAKGEKLLYQHVRNVLVTPVKTASS